MSDIEIWFRFIIVSFAIIGVLCTGGFILSLGIFIAQGKGGLKEFIREEW